MSGLSEKIRPGDPLTTAALQANFDAFEADLAAVTGAEVDDRIVDTVHLDSKVAHRGFVVAAIPSASGWSANHSLVSQSVSSTSGEPVYVRATLELSTVSAATGNIQFDLEVDAVSVVSRSHQLVLGGGSTVYGTIRLLWAFAATGSSHTVEVVAVSAHGGMVVDGGDLVLESVVR